jgi:hypothetical protein
MDLTDSAVAAIEPKTRPFKVGAGDGLYLLVNPDGSRYWRFKYRIAGKEKCLSLGVHPGVSLDTARERRDLYRQLLSDGEDPGEYQRKMKLAERDAQARQIAATRFTLDHEGGLSVKLGNRRVDLTPTETAQLRTFLDATRAVPIREERPWP